MCCIYDLVYSLETHIKHVHLEASKGYKTQHTVPATSGWRAATAGAVVTSYYHDSRTCFNK